MVKVKGTASTHLVKYFVVVMMNLWPSEEGGEIDLIGSNAHYEKGHGDMIGCNSCVGAWIRLICIWIL